ncbi:MAG: ferredoxin--NADP reductase [Betaproteobacteria bacterium]
MFFLKYETTIQQIIPRTSDVTSFRFPKQRGLDYKAGQFFFVTIKTGDRELTKPFSFSSSPTEPEHIEFTKKFTDHEFSLALRACKVGDWARIDAPYGKLTFEGEYPKIALLSGGIGITPFMSIIKNATDKRLGSQITLFYGCRTEKDIVFKKELEESTKTNKNLKLVFLITEPSPQWRGETGIITADLVKEELPDYKENMFYTCGPPGMVTAMEKLVETIGLPKEKIKKELFAGY